MSLRNVKSILVPAIAPVLAAMAFSSCDSGSAGSSASTTSATQSVNTTSGGTTTGTGTGTGTGSSSVAVGSPCTGDSSKTCLAIHFVTYKDSSGTPTATTDQAATIVNEMNSLWAQCGIAFEIEKYEQVDPTTSGLSYGAASQNELDQIRQAYGTVSNELLAVTTGPWGTSVNAWTNMPGDGIYGAIMEASIVTYGNGIIYGHEFGHYLGLDHVSDTSNLMNPVIYTTSTALTSSQCQTAKDTIASYWSAMVRN